jgi:F0F1-type ATP synthase membrane subunit b/b'
MGFADNAKDALDATGQKIGRAFEDAKDRIEDKADEVKADAEVKRAEAEVKHAETNRDATKATNDFKEDLRGDN